ncbi:MAG: ribonuclease III [Defluviitaleaceae bacterium]|nr:ribonuclease III [Defluviitaleaceae bacterium]
MAQGISAASLAYLGDAVFELWAREMLIAEGLPVNKANRRAKDIVSATAQADMYHRIYQSLTPDEQTIMRRGRNLNPLTRAKNADTASYRHATGLEALFGHLYNTRNIERLEEIFKQCTSHNKE